MTLAQGDRLGRYEVLGPIGAGGMGEVWRARDTELDRQVAVKILPESFAGDSVRLERFQREAKALAALSHPNLLDIYDVGSSNDLHYAVTELLEGDTLRERITPTGLPWQKVTQIGAAVADGLAAAHGRGIVHRDLKPENLFLTADGRVKILDFGLAAMHEGASPDARTATITEAGTVMGTPGYMAPEQVKGQPADTRSDIFSLGCVLYEMASGHRAFGGDTGAEVIAAILKEEPPQLSSSGAAVPVDLERAVHRCLEKRPEARFQSAADLAYSLKSVGHSGTAPVMATPSGVTAEAGRRRPMWQVAVAALLIMAGAFIAWRALSPGSDDAPVEVAAALDPNRIAVVPFVNRTGDGSLDGLASMTADRITQGLAGLTEIEVAPASVVAAASSGIDPALVVGEVAAKTDSGLVLTGVWDAVGAGLELQATLEDAQRRAVVRAFDPIPVSREAPQEAVATLRDWTLMAVQDHLHPILAWGAGDRFPVYEAYLMHRRYFEILMSRGPGVNTLQAVQLKLQATQVDPLFARPRIQTAGNWMPGIVKYIHDAMLEFYEPVHEMELTPHQQRLVAMIDSRLEGQWENAFRLAQNEFERDPSDSWQRAQLIVSAHFDHRPGVVLELFNELDFDPLAPEPYRFTVTSFVADSYHLLGRHEEELAVARNLLAGGPTTTTGGSARAPELRALAALGRTDEIDRIVTEVKLERDVMSTDGDEMLTVVYELRAHGFIEQSRALAERVVKWYEDLAVATPDERCDPCLAEALEAAGRGDEACGLYDDALTDEPDNPWYNQRVGLCAARHGDRETALEMEARIEEIGEPAEPTGVPNVWRGRSQVLQAGIAARLGDRDRAVKLIQRAIAAGFASYRWLHVDPDLDPLRSHPEFQEIVRPKG
jgi:tetratricopeptide (TPR) repeat protein